MFFKKEKTACISMSITDLFKTIYKKGLKQHQVQKHLLFGQLIAPIFKKNRCKRRWKCQENGAHRF